MSKLKPEISLEVSPELESNSLGELQDWIRTNRVDEVECVTPDMAGVARGKVMPASKFVRESEIRLPISLFMATITGEYADIEAEGYDVDADVYLAPDFSTARAVPWANDPSIQIIHDAYDRDGKPIAYAPRQVLKRVIDLYKKKGWIPIVSPEIEFYLTKPNTDPDYPLEPPVGRSGRQSLSNQAYSLSAVDEHERVIEHIYDYAAAQNLDIDTIIQESGAGQLEINLMHGDPLKLADEVFLYKRLIREAALQCGIHATFMAKPMEDQPGSAMHVHQSIISSKTGKNVFSNKDGSPSELFYHFIGGQQKYMYDACAFAAPYVNSYRRLVPNWSAPVNLEWAHDNRSAGLRAPRSSPSARRVENRVIGADANPYLAIAASLATGYLGMTKKIEPRKEASVEFEHRSRDLPFSLLGAVDALHASADLKRVLGAQFVDIFAAIKQAEHDEFMKVISPWEREHLLLSV
ncbi:MAG: glutamine synthetase family protein [Pseudomonadota bacterium]